MGAKIHSVDLPANIAHGEHPGRRRGRLVRGLPVTLHEGDGRKIAQTLINQSPNSSLLVFIDGDHSYQNALNDARAVLSSAPHASLLFHDTFYQPSAGYNHGPYQAVQQILREAPGHRKVAAASLGCPGMTLVAHSGPHSASEFTP